MRGSLSAACVSALPLMLAALSAQAAQTGPPPSTATPLPPVPAQTPAPTPSPGDASTVTEVVVTAQKRAQNLQDVPIAVTVVNTKQLQDANVHDIGRGLRHGQGASGTGGICGRSVLRLLLRDRQRQL